MMERVSAQGSCRFLRTLDNQIFNALSTSIKYNGTRRGHVSQASRSPETYNLYVVEQDRLSNRRYVRLPFDRDTLAIRVSHRERTWHHYATCVHRWKTRDLAICLA